MIKIEHDTAINEIKEIELSAAEIKEIEKLQKANQIALAAAQVKADAKETAKAAILDRIGLTADELKTILG